MRFQSLFMLITAQPLFFCFRPRRIEKRTNFGIRQTASGTVCVLALRIIVQNQHHEPCTTGPLGPIEHLLITARISESGARPLANE